MRLKLNHLSLWLLLLVCFPVAAQLPQRGDNAKSLNYGFVSPNTRENLRLSQAIEMMSSEDEAQMIRRIGSFKCVVQTNVSALPALGSWSDGAEYSVMLRLNSDETTLRYILSRVGKEARQKSVLYFHPTSSGSARIYALRPRRNTKDLTTIAATMEKAGVAFRTLVPTKRSTVVFIVDLKRELHPKVLAAAHKLRANWSSEKGRAGFIGDDNSAEKAQTVFDKEIQDYESKHPRLPSTCAENKD